MNRPKPCEVPSASGKVQRTQQRVQQVAVAGLGEAGAGRVRGEPGDPVDLAVGGEAAVRRLGGPVADLLAVSVHVVVGGGEAGAGHAAESGLLLDLAQGGREGVLGALELAFRMGPIAIFWSMNQ